MKYKIYAGEKVEWDKYVRESEDSFFYHLFDWKEVIEKTFGHKTYYLMAKDDNKVVGIMPLVHMKSFLFGNFMVSLPFLNYAGILADNIEVGRSLLEEAIRIARQEKIESIEFRYVDNYDYKLVTKKNKVTMILSIEDGEDALLKGFRSEIRNRIKKSKKAGITIKKGGIEALDGFYNAYAINMRDLGTPVYGKSFFYNIFNAFPENCSVFSAILEDKVIGAGIGIGYKDTFEMPWVSSIQKYFKLAPNNLLYWEAIIDACQNSYSKFDFGRSSWDSGTFTFKKRWGAEPVQLHWQYWLPGGAELPQLNPDNPKYRLALNIWKKLPVALANIIGPHIVKNIP